MKGLHTFLAILVSFSLSHAQLNPASQDAMNKAEAAMAAALESYDYHYPDLALWKEAIAQAREALRLAPNQPEPLKLLAKIYSHSNWYGPAAQAWQNYLATGAQLDFESVPLFVDVNAKLAYSAYEQGNKEAALDYYLYIIDKVPYDKEGFVWAGRILLELAKPAQAIAYWQTVVERDSTDKRAKYFLELAKAQHQWGIKAATAFYEGVAFYEQGDPQRARERFARTVGFNEMYSEAWAWLGRVEFEQGNFSEASSYYREANKLEPNNETYKYFYQESERRKN